MNFSVSVSVKNEINLRHKTPLAIYEKILEVDERGILRLASYRSQTGVLSPDVTLPYPALLGTRVMNFDFPAVSYESPESPLRMELLESVVFIIGRNLKTREAQEINISEFVIEDAKTIKQLITILNTGQITDDEGRARKVFGVSIDLDYTKLNVAEIEANMDSLKIGSNTIGLEVEALPERSSVGKVVFLENYRLRNQRSAKQTLPSQLIKLKDLHARCSIVYQ